MIRLTSLLALCLCFIAGCSRGALDDNADADQAGPALRNALEAWKEGKSPADLENEKSILMNDNDWRSGKRLVYFKMDERSSMFGRQIRWEVSIQLEDKDGKSKDRKVTYLIDTTPRLVIVRDIFS